MAMNAVFDEVTVFETPAIQIYTVLVRSLNVTAAIGLLWATAQVLP